MYNDSSRSLDLLRTLSRAANSRVTYTDLEVTVTMNESGAPCAKQKKGLPR